MGKLKSFLNSIFAIILFAISLVVIMVALELVPIENVLGLIADVILNNNIATIAIASLIILSTIFACFIKTTNTEDMKSGVAIKQDGGTVYLAKDTFESIVLNITKTYASLKNVKVSVTISEQGIITNIYAYILPDTVVQTLSNKLQENVKTSISKQTTIEIKEVNLKIKGVYVQPEKKA